MKISVLTPSYNSARYIARAIESVLSQNYKDWEHIIVDGNSTDGTQEVLKKYPHLIWISEPDKGQSDAMNKAFTMATGELIVYINADDWFEPNVFSEVHQYFKNFPETSILVGNLYFRDLDNHPTRLNISEHKIKNIILPFKYGFPYNPLAYFYRKSVQDKVGKFPVSEHYVMDYWFILRAFTRPNVVKKSELVFGTYFHTGFNKSSLQKSGKILRIAKQSINKENENLRLHFYYHYLYHLVFKVPLLTAIKSLKILLIVIIKRQVISFNELNENGLKFYLRK